MSDNLTIYITICHLEFVPLFFNNDSDRKTGKVSTRCIRKTGISHLYLFT